jgi:hypothetical protein
MENLKRILFKTFKEDVTFEEYPNSLFLICHSFGVCRFTRESIWLNAIHLEHEGDLPSKVYAKCDEETLMGILEELQNRVATVRRNHEAEKLALAKTQKADTKLRSDYPLAEIRNITPGFVGLTLTTAEARVALEAIRKEFRTI